MGILRRKIATKKMVALLLSLLAEVLNEHGYRTLLNIELKRIDLVASIGLGNMGNVVLDAAHDEMVIDLAVLDKDRPGGQLVHLGQELTTAILNVFGVGLGQYDNGDGVVHIPLGYLVPYEDDDGSRLKGDLDTLAYCFSFAYAGAPVR